LWKAGRRRGLDPYRYLRELLTALPTMTNWQLEDWTPEAWAKRNFASYKAA
jgi:transposase